MPRVDGGAAFRVFEGPELQPALLQTQSLPGREQGGTVGGDEVRPRLATSLESMEP
jgi:hypothetical protein